MSARWNRAYRVVPMELATRDLLCSAMLVLPHLGRGHCDTIAMLATRKLLYSCAVLNLYAVVFELFCSLSCLTFHRVKSNKSARHRQNKAQQPFARAVYEHSVVCCLPLTAYRSSIGGKRTRFPRTNGNAKNTAQTPFALYSMLERLFAVI